MPAPQSITQSTLHNAHPQLTIISSSKIQKKVTQALTLLFPLDASSEDAKHYLRGQADNADGPKTIELTAKSPVASKLITVVEIVKREASARLKARRRDSSAAIGERNGSERGDPGSDAKGLDGGRNGIENGGGAGRERKQETSPNLKLYQYTSLTAIAPVPKGPPPRKTTTVDAATALDEYKLDATPNDAAAPGTGTNTQSRKRKAPNSTTEDDDEDDDAAEFFETLEPSTKRLMAAAAPERFAKPERMVPVLRVVLSWERVEKLRREGWGEQSVP